MEEDDEFGDLYTDVFPTIYSAPAPPPPQSPSALHPRLQASSSTLPLSSRLIDLNLTIPDDEAVIPSASHSRTLAPSTAPIQEADVGAVDSSRRVSDPSVSTELPKCSLQGAVQQVNKGVDFMDTDVKFDIEEADADPDDGSLAGMTGLRRSNDGDDWDSDSEDELQIVLNENPPLGAMGMFGDGGDDDGGDEDPLIIVADGDPNQATETTDWGEDAGQTGPDGERKEPGGEAAKTSGAVAVPPKVGYSSHGYQPFHSQFKYVRPGVASIPGPNAAGPGEGQVRPPMNVGAVGGRGRGEWRPPGIRPGAPFQKNYQAGFAPPTWGSGRGFGGGGLDFTLPSHKTIFEVDIDSFEEKPWKYPGADITDFFNFGLNEESWKDYSKQLGQHRLQTTMQSRIRVHEGVRTEKDFDPDMPPELAAASGNHDVRTKNANVGKADAGQIDPNTPPPRPPIPAGRPILVEIASVERLPTMDTRLHRFRDSDAIEIALQGSLDYNSSTGQDDEDHHDNGTPTNEVDENNKAEKESVHEDNNSDTCSDKNKELVRRASRKFTPDNRDRISPQVPASLPPASSRGQIPVSGESKGSNVENRRNEGRRADYSRSPHESPTYSAEEERRVDIREESTDCLERKSGACQLSLERNDVSSVSGDGTYEAEKDRVLDEEGYTKTPDLESKLPSIEEDFDDGENSSRAARSSEKSKARSGSSREYQKRHRDNEEEVIQKGQSMHMTSNRRNLEVDEQDNRRRVSDEVERIHHLVLKGGREAVSYEDMDMKSEGLDRRRGKDKYDKAAFSQWKNGDPQGRGSRAEETQKWDRIDDVGFRHRSRKEMDNSLYEVNFDKDLSSRPREREDGYPNKRKKEEHVRRNLADKEEMIQHGNRESMARKKRERERDDSDDHYSNKHRDDQPMRRERSEKQKNKDVSSKLRQTHNEDVPKRGRGAEDKPRVAHGRSKDEYRVSDKEYQYKDTSRQMEQVKSRDHVIVDESKNHPKGRDDVRSQGMVEEKKSRTERLTSRSIHSTNFSENQKMHEREHRESTRKNKESEAGDHNAAVASKRKRDDQTDRVADRGITAVDGGEEASSEDEQADSRRGRSKLERWTSHKDREYTINSTSSSSLKMKEVRRSSSSNGGRKEHPPKAVQFDAIAEETESTADVKPVDNNKLLETVEKLKKRSERFKLPLPIEKEGQTVRKTDIEALPSFKSDVPTTDTETKHERPARKRRWISG